jgi:PTH1 family peptidyl-tRNA hydrolase
VISRLFRRRQVKDFAGWVIVGLGNPGSAYAQTRHNVGYLVTDELAARMGGSWRSHRANRVLAVEGRLGRLPGVRAVLVRGRCFMNESGGPVSGVLKFYGADPGQLVVIHDEIDLPYGDLRVKLGGGDNGHNGLKSIRRSLGTGDYYRVRFGVGRPGWGGPADHVLSVFSAAERRDLGVHVQRAADAVESLVTAGLQATQNMFNS